MFSPCGAIKGWLIYLGKSVRAWSCSGEQTAVSGMGVSLAVAVGAEVGSELAVWEGAALGLGVRVGAGAAQPASKTVRRRGAKTGFTSQF